MRVVDQAFPAYRGPGFLEIHAHDDQQGVTDPVSDRLEVSGVLHGGSGVVDGAGPYHHHQSMIDTIQYVRHRLPGRRHPIMNVVADLYCVA